MNSCDILVIIIVACLIYGLLSYLNQACNSTEKPKTEDFRFELSPYKKCQGELYELTPQSALYKECTDPTTVAVLNQMSCPKSMTRGIKPQFQYTPLSNAEWKNTRCDPKSECASNALEELNKY